MNSEVFWTKTGNRVSIFYCLDSEVKSRRLTFSPKKDDVIQYKTPSSVLKSLTPCPLLYFLFSEWTYDLSVVLSFRSIESTSGTGPTTLTLWLGTYEDSGRARETECVRKHLYPKFDKEKKKETKKKLGHYPYLTYPVNPIHLFDRLCRCDSGDVRHRIGVCRCLSSFLGQRVFVGFRLEGRTLGRHQWDLPIEWKIQWK